MHGALAIALASVLALSALLAPSPTGRGTHRQLGLPDCLVAKILGRERCPSCGLTTAFCHLMRGQVRLARQCHPAALYVLLMCVAIILYCVMIAISGRQWLAYELPAVAGLSLVLLGVWIAAL